MSAPATTAQLIQQGLFHHRQGDLKQAMERYAEVLRTDPENADALYYIAVVACQEGQFQQGAELARRALAKAGLRRARTICSAARWSSWASRWRRSRISTRPSPSTPISPRRTATAPISW